MSQMATADFAMSCNSAMRLIQVSIEEAQGEEDPHLGSGSLGGGACHNHQAAAGGRGKGGALYLRKAARRGRARARARCGRGQVRAGARNTLFNLFECIYALCGGCGL